ncbi:Hint domain-containing protein [Paracoccus spongiarum]|uniref:Hint domain-containing protein n=1 Tax=Paracoccus spongiarum TaxID=3064387 RepID=A0ABT9J9W6_9RHOB|nr:Hint domain-containing protein [Paracoccus sp. 2205BS29-5]MDP5306599.1 Hint domain-containing protein [Paracoccus sp. 2205BS29-5]
MSDFNYNHYFNYDPATGAVNTVQYFLFGDPSVTISGTLADGEGNGDPYVLGEQIFGSLGSQGDIFEGTLEIGGITYVILSGAQPPGTYAGYAVSPDPATTVANFPATVDPTLLQATDFVPCFAQGTRLDTADGTRPVETLNVGDLVWTADHGLQPVRWIGSRHCSPARLAASPQLRPIAVAAGALGKGLPSADLLVSPQHRVLVRSKIAQRMFGCDEILVAAKHLLELDGIEIAPAPEGVTYYHVLFDRHELVRSNGAITESLYTGKEALEGVGDAARQEIFTIFPELEDAEIPPQAARTLASGRMGRRLAERHRLNRRILVSA